MVEMGYTLWRTHSQKASACESISEAVGEAGPGRFTYSLTLMEEISLTGGGLLGPRTTAAGRSLLPGPRAHLHQSEASITASSPLSILGKSSAKSNFFFSMCSCFSL